MEQSSVEIEEPLEEKLSDKAQKKTMSRRHFLKGAAAIAGAAFLGRIPGVNRESMYSPEVLAGKPTEYGFTTHLYLDTKEGEVLTLDKFKEGVDILQRNNQKWLRFNIWDWETAPTGTPDSIGWNEENLALFDEAVDYANERGLKINLVTNVPNFAKDYSHEDYKKVTENYYSFLANRYKDKVSSWQIFNEPNIHSFRDYSFKPSQLTQEYVDDLTEVVSVANKAIKDKDPDALTTVNLSHWVGHGADIRREGIKLFDPLAPHIDQITLDLYPDDNVLEIKNYPGYVLYFRNRYKKDVVIGELGLPTDGYRFDEGDQAKYVTMALDELQGGLYKPSAILLYQLINETTQQGVQNNFGFITADGRPKEAFSQVIERMQTEESDQETGKQAST